MTPYVIMRDSFLSGWGRAEGRTNLLIIKCSSLDVAQKIKMRAQKRPEMKNIRITEVLPYYSPTRYLVQHYWANEATIAKGALYETVGEKLK